MKYSKNPKDWYYTLNLDFDCRVYSISLSMDSDILHGDLTSDKLPKEIKLLLIDIDVLTGEEVYESTWQILPWNKPLDKPAIEKHLLSHGFKKSNRELSKQ